MNYRHTCVLMTLLVALVAAGCSHLSYRTGSLLIQNVNVVDAQKGLRLHQDVWLQGDRIEHIGDTGLRPVQASQVIDGSNRFLIPGLWDFHVHFSYEADTAEAMINLFLANGITQVRDTGGPLDAVLRWRQKAAEAYPSAPQVFIAGPLLDGIPVVYDGSAPGSPELGVQLATPADAVSQVDRLADAGVDFIKAYEMLEPPVFDALMKRASERGLPVAGHVPLTVPAAAVSSAGMDSIEHLRNIELGCSSEEQSMLAERAELMNNPDHLSGAALRSKAHGLHRYRAVATVDWDRCERLLELHRENRTRHVPTLALIQSVFLKRHTSDAWNRTYQYLPESSRMRWQEQSEKMAGLFSDDPDGDTDRESYLEWVNRTVHWMADKSMLMAGTDTPIFFMTPGFSLHWELQALVENGLTELQALEAATLTPARFFGLDREMGSVEAGYRADLVLLNSNPLEYIGNTREIESVIHAGRVFDREKLDEMLQDAASY